MSIQYKWTFSLPDCGHAITSTLLFESNLFAAGNGYVYQLDFLTGQLLAENSLSGLGHYEVRLAVSDTLQLIVGTNGFIVGLNATSSPLSTIWQTSLPGCGYNTTSVLVGSGDWNNVGYAACNGYVYSFNISTGEIQHQNNLAGMGLQETRLATTPANDNNLSGTYIAEVRLALRQDGGVLFAGTNGFAVGLKASDLTTIYSTTLPDCGYAVTDVVAGNIFTYFACNGYLYNLDELGNVIGHTILPDLGYHETRLAISTAGEEHVFAGINGYAVGL
ncbi:hypothetical protein DL93DRAFT_2041800, partial [Clavulina sp. PMI_390]